jgi:hypothetical protein
MDTAAIQQALTPLVGLPLRHIGRAANLMWLHFGELREVTTREGGSKVVGDWALHVQCAWRLCRHGGIVVAYRDYYYSPENEPLDDWDVPGKSRFDHTVQSLQMEFDATPPAALSIVADDVGGFSISLSRDYRLDVFPDDSSHDEYSEHWRLFEPYMDREHFVVPCRNLARSD